MKDYVLGIDIGGTNLRYAATTRDGEVLYRHMESSAPLTLQPAPVTALGDGVAAVTASIPHRLVGLCVGFPGTVSRDKNTVYSCPLYACFERTAVADPLAQRFSVPVMVEHDVIPLMTYDLRHMPLEGISCIIGVYLGTGLGNAIWANGDFLYGADNVAGELGHIPVYGQDALCPCGNRGCLECYASGKLLQELCASDFPSTPMEEVFVRHGESKVFDDFLEAVAVAIATEVNILNPDRVILGGGVFHMKAFPMRRLETRIRMHTRKPFPHDTLHFVPAARDAFAGAMGAAFHLWKQPAMREA